MAGSYLNPFYASVRSLIKLCLPSGIDHLVIRTLYKYMARRPLRVCMLRFITMVRLSYFFGLVIIQPDLFTRPDTSGAILGPVRFAPVKPVSLRLLRMCTMIFLFELSDI